MQGLQRHTAWCLMKEATSLVLARWYRKLRGFWLEAAMKEIDTAISGAFKEANIERADIGCFCLAGADFPEDFEMLKKAVENLNR